MRSAIYYSHDTDSFQAGHDAMLGILANLAGRRPELLLLFSSIGHDLPCVLNGIKAAAGPDVPVCGCTGSGVISGLGSDEATHSIVLMGIAQSGLWVTPFLFSGLSSDPEGVGGRIADIVQHAAIRNDESALLLLFADGLTINADRLNRGLQAGLSRHIDIVGGTAGNDFERNVTYQLGNGQVVSDGVSGALLRGNFHYSIEVSHGSRPVGLFRTITRTSGSVICEIDHLPALDVVKELLGVDRVRDVGQMLTIFELGEDFPGQGYSENILNRAIIGVDEELGGIRLAVEISEGSKIRITRRDRDLVLRRTREMTEAMVSELHDWRNAAYLYFNCIGRGSYLFGDPEQDINVIREVLTPEINLAGFFSFGEFAPINNRNYFHNYSGVLVGLE